MLFQEQVQLDKRRAYWQQVLRLQDWDVAAKVVRQDKLTLGRQGECQWGLERKEAIIRLLDPIDYPDDCQRKQDHELTLVHELLHLHFAAFAAEGGAAEIAQEQAIQCIAKALVALERGEWV